MDALRTFLEVFVRALVALMALDIGLSTSIHHLRKELGRPALWRGLLVALLIVPALAVGVAKALPLSPVGRGVLVLMAVSPGAPRLMTRVRERGGNVPLACVLASGLAVACVAAVPLELAALNAIFPVALRVEPFMLMRALLPGLLLPLALGIAALAARPAAAAKLEPALRRIVRTGTLLLMLAVLVAGGRWLGEVRPSAWVAMVVVTLGAATIGHADGGPDPRDRHTVACAVVFGNPAVALLVARTSYPELELAPAIACYVILRTLAMVPYDVVLRRSRSGGGTSPTPRDRVRASAS
jgi:BASS family bile acid:Na+ symporter